MIKKGRVLTYQWKLKWLPSHSKITFHNSSFSFFTTKAKQPLTKKEPNEIVLKAGQDRSKKDTLYLHVAPDGDHWISGELFAAKHLQPDYVKSILIPNEIEMNILKTIEDFENVDGFDVLMKDVYDTGDLSRLLERST
jgi:hypothetical protein